MNTPDGNLPVAINRLRNAIHAMAHPQYEQANGRWAEIPPLYTQLYDAVPGARGTHNHQHRSMPPCWLEAADTLAKIDTATRKWQPTYQHTPGCLPALQRLTQLDGRKWRPQDTPTIELIATELETWATLIEALLYPPEHSGLYLDAPCPHCGHEYDYHYDSSHEYVRAPALILDLTTGATCTHCHSHWPRERLYFLSRILGCEPQLEVLPS